MQHQEQSQNPRHGYSGDLISFQPLATNYAGQGQQKGGLSRGGNDPSIIDESMIMRDTGMSYGGAKGQSIKGNYPSTFHNPLLSVSGERNQSQLQIQGNAPPPHLLQAHTLGNISRVTTSRQIFNEQSPVTPDKTGNLGRQGKSIGQAGAQIYSSDNEMLTDGEH